MWVTPRPRCPAAAWRGVIHKKRPEAVPQAVWNEGWEIRSVGRRAWCPEQCSTPIGGGGDGALPLAETGRGAAERLWKAVAFVTVKARS